MPEVLFFRPRHGVWDGEADPPSGFAQGRLFGDDKQEGKGQCGCSVDLRQVEESFLAVVVGRSGQSWLAEFFGVLRLRYAALRMTAKTLLQKAKCGALSTARLTMRP